MSLNSLDREGARLLSPRDSQITSKTSCRDRWYRSRRFDWAQVGVWWRLGTILRVLSGWSVVVPSWGYRFRTLSHVGGSFLFWHRSRAMSDLYDGCYLCTLMWRGECKPTMYLFPYSVHGLCEEYPTCDIAYNAVMPLSRASTRGRYIRIMGVTSW